MKLIYKLTLLFFMILGFQVHSSEIGAPNAALSDTEQDELRKFADQLIGALDPNMSSEEKNKLVDQTVQETLQMDSYLKSLPESERKEKEKEIEDAVSYLLSPESPVKELFDEKASDEEPIKETKEEKEKSKADKEDKKDTLVISKDAKALKEILESIISRIGSLLVKVKSMPRISTDKQVEIKWGELKTPINLFESILKIVIKKDKLLNTLTSDEYKSLKNNICKFKNDFVQKELNFKVPDTAGLTIIYDEDEEDNVEFESAQKQLKEIILIIDQTFEKEIIKDFKEFLQKNAPEELTKVPELEKGLEQIENNRQKQSGVPSGAPYAPSRSGSVPSGSGYYYGGSSRPSYNNFPSLDFPSGSLPSADQSTDRKDQPKQPEIDAKTKDKDSKEKKDSEDSEKKKAKSPEKKQSIDKQITELRTSFKDLSNTYEKSNVSELVDRFKDKSKSKSRPVSLDIRDFATNLNELEINYDKSSKIISRIGGSLKTLQQDTQEIYKNAIRGIYYDPEIKLEDNYKKLEKASKEIKDKGFLSKSANEKIEQLIKTHESLKESIGIKPKGEEDTIKSDESDSQKLDSEKIKSELKSNLEEDITKPQSTSN